MTIVTGARPKKLEGAHLEHLKGTQPAIDWGYLAANWAPQECVPCRIGYSRFPCDAYSRGSRPENVLESSWMAGCAFTTAPALVQIARSVPSFRPPMTSYHGAADRYLAVKLVAHPNCPQYLREMLAPIAGMKLRESADDPIPAPEAHPFMPVWSTI